jgi:hypothetical protein
MMAAMGIGIINNDVTIQGGLSKYNDILHEIWEMNQMIGVFKGLFQYSLSDVMCLCGGISKTKNEFPKSRS